MKLITAAQYDDAVSNFDALSEHSELFFRHENAYVEIIAISKDSRDFYVARVADVKAHVTIYSLMHDTTKRQKSDLDYVAHLEFATFADLLRWQISFTLEHSKEALA